MPQFYTANESEEGGDDREAEEEVDVPESAIWDLSARWNKKYLPALTIWSFSCYLQVKQKQSKARDRDSTKHLREARGENAPVQRQGGGDDSSV